MKPQKRQEKIIKQYAKLEFFKSNLQPKRKYIRPIVNNKYKGKLREKKPGITFTDELNLSS